MLNTITIIGRMTKDPITNYTNAKMPVCSFTIACGRENSDQVDYVDIVTFGKQAEACQKYTQKGSMVCVQGSLRIDSYTTKDGKSGKSVKIQGNKVVFLNNPNNKQQFEPELPIF